MRIHKFILPDKPGSCEICTNSDTLTPLSVQLQFGEPMLWASVEPKADAWIELEVVAVMTGQKAPNDATYIGTALLEHGAFVLHYFRTK